MFELLMYLSITKMLEDEEKKMLEDEKKMFEDEKKDKNDTRI